MRTHRTARLTAALILAAVLVVGGSAGCSLAARSERTSGGSAGVAPPESATTGYAGAPSSAKDAAVGSASSPQPQVSGSASPASVPVAERLVIRNANVRLEVAKVQAALTRIRALAAAQGAVVSSLQLSSDTGGGVPVPTDGSGRILRSGLPYTASVTVLVPVAKFDTFRTSAEKLGTVLSEQSADDDVTQQHADLKARLANARAEEARLRTFFDKARTVNDMLSIERELARVRGDIESMTAQLDTMERQAAMATLTLELVEPQPIVRPSNGIDWGFADALTTGVQAMAGLLRAGIVMVIATAPIWIAAVALVLVVRWRLKARRSRRDQPEAPETGKAS